MLCFAHGQAQPSITVLQLSSSAHDCDSYVPHEYASALTLHGSRGCRRCRRLAPLLSVGKSVEDWRSRKSRHGESRAPDGNPLSLRSGVLRPRSWACPCSSPGAAVKERSRLSGSPNSPASSPHRAFRCPRRHLSCHLAVQQVGGPMAAGWVGERRPARSAHPSPSHSGRVRLSSLLSPSKVPKRNAARV